MSGDWLQLDEEPWTPELPDPDAGIDLLDGAVLATAAWLTALVLTAAALAVALALLALRRLR